MKNKTKFNWNSFLDRAIEKPSSITEKEHKQVCNMSDSWVTCGCGVQCDILPRGWNGMPKDDISYRLGVKFNTYIIMKRYNNAKETLTKIESRSSFLLDKIVKSYTKDLKSLGYSITRTVL